MRPTIFLSASVAAALAASALVTPAVAQNPEVITRLGDRLRVFGAADRDRAVLGVTLSAARGRADTLGVRVTDVASSGPADKAGIEEGDRITAIDGTSLRMDAADADDPELSDLANRRLQRVLGRHKPGDEVTLTVARGRETRTVKVKTVAADELSPMRAIAVGSGFGGNAPIMLRNGEWVRSFGDSARARTERRPALGLTVGATGNRRDTLGLFVSGVASDGPAERAGIVEGARIASIGNVDVRVTRDDLEDPEVMAIRSRRFTRELERHEPGDDVSLRVWQNGAYRTVTAKVGRTSDVYKGRTGFSYWFGDGDGVMMPPMAPMPPMPAIAPTVRMLPMAPRAPMPPAAPRVRLQTRAE